MYKSYLILINDYFLSLKEHVFFDIIFPTILATLAGVLLHYELLYLDKTFVTNILTVLGIIAGFSVTAIAVLTSTDNPTVKELKSKLTGIVIDGLEISAFRRFYILISYSVLISFCAILINTIGYLVPWHKINKPELIVILKAVNLWLIFHIFFINIRNVSSLYFIYFKETNTKLKPK